MQAESRYPLLHIVVGGSTNQHWILDHTLFCEDNPEGVLTTCFGFGNLDEDKVVEWLEVLWLKIVFLLHAINLEVDKACVG